MVFTISWGLSRLLYFLFFTQPVRKNTTKLPLILLPPETIGLGSIPQPSPRPRPRDHINLWIAASESTAVDHHAIATP